MPEGKQQFEIELTELLMEAAKKGVITQQDAEMAYTILVGGYEGNAAIDLKTILTFISEKMPMIINIVQAIIKLLNVQKLPEVQTPPRTVK